MAAIDNLVLEHHFYTVALLPDTRKYAEKYPDILRTQTDFLARNRVRGDIVFVSHLGDIVEHGGRGSDGSRAELLPTLFDGERGFHLPSPGGGHAG
jgi:hypothetical protein